MYAKICNPQHIACSTEDIKTAQANLTTIKARAVVDSAVHPETGEIVGRMFRRSAFVLFNTPLYFAIAASPNTIGWQLTWQVVNQGYNGVMNYYNRSGTSQAATIEVCGNTCLATGAAVTSFFGIRRLLKNVNFGNGIASLTIQRGLIPAATVIAATTVNVLTSRRSELQNGVAVRTAPNGDGEIIGYSQVAAEKGIKATLMSRAMLPLPSLTISLFAKTLMEKYKFRPLVQYPTLGLVVLTTQLISLPMSLAPWAWFMPISIKDLEPDLRRKASARGLSSLYFNKGL